MIKIDNKFSSNSNSDFWLGTFVGSLFGFVAAIVALLGLVPKFNDSEWETLAAGALAALGAGGTVYIINKQIWASEFLRRRQQIQSDKIARAEANSVLAQVCIESELAAIALMDKQEISPIDSGTLIPFHTLAGSENEAVARWSLYLISSVQVFNSRTREELAIDDPSRSTYIIDAFEIMAIANFFWDYLRGRSDSIGPSMRSLESQDSAYPLYHGVFRDYPDPMENTEIQIEFFNRELKARNHHFLSYWKSLT